MGIVLVKGKEETQHIYEEDLLCAALIVFKEIDISQHKKQRCAFCSSARTIWGLGKNTTGRVGTWSGALLSHRNDMRASLSGTPFRHPNSAPIF